MHLDKKQRKWSRILPPVIALVIVAAALAVLFINYTFCAGRLYPRRAAALDLREQALSVQDYHALRARFPDTDVLWRVPLGGSRYDCDAESIVLTALTTAEAENLALLPGLRQVDARQAALTEETYLAMRTAAPDCEIRWSIPIGGGRYDSRATEIVLSDFTVGEAPLFSYFERLAQADATGCGCYDALLAARALLPDCHFRWNVTLGGKRCGQGTAALAPVGGSMDYDELLEGLAWLPALTLVELPNTAFTAQQQTALMERYPAIHFLWPVTLFGESFSSGAERISLAGRTDLTDAALPELRESLHRFYRLREVDLTGCAFSQSALLDTAEALPALALDFDMTLYGVALRTDAAELDLSNIQIDDLAPLEQALPHMKKLEKVVMCDCGLDDETMDGLDQKYPGVRFVWMLHLGRYNVRTDAVGFCSNTIMGANVTNEDAQRLRYCTDMQVLDLGHESITDLSFMQSMPHLRYVILASCTVSDLSGLAGLQELQTLELQLSSGVSDLSPLLTCPALLDVNIGYIHTGCGEELLAVLTQMTQLERLWYSNNIFTAEQKAALQAALPDTQMYCAYNVDHCAFNGWRYHDRYYDMRDLLGLHYMNEDGDRFRLRLVDGEWVLWDTEGIF